MYVFDIDGTIANIEHRLHYIKSNHKNCDAFHEACDQDVIIKSVAKIAAYILNRDRNLVYCTGRPERVRSKTIKWLDRHNLWMRGNTHLLMREDHDYRPDYIVKPELLDQLPHYASIFDNKVTAIFEDRQSVVQMWRSLGYTCFQVCDGNY